MVYSSRYWFDHLPMALKLWPVTGRSEEHTSELQSQSNLVCRLLLEKKNIQHEKVMLPHKNESRIIVRHLLAPVLRFRCVSGKQHDSILQHTVTRSTAPVSAPVRMPY